jgi:UDP-2-acetamido-2-deoxy-ribo-hexuluronate aminotransferase
MEFINLKHQYRLLEEDVNFRIKKVLEHGQYIMGPEVAELEATLAKFTGSKECITVASGTEALLIALMALNIGPGDEVITSPFTFAATGEVIRLVGAIPVFADVDPGTCNITVEAIQKKMSKKTKAIMPVSLYGQVADMDEIEKIAKDHGIVVIEDAAQSFGATYKGRRSCNLSAIGCTSFFPSKPLGCYGDGGAIFTNDVALAKAMREIRVHGQEKRYVHTRIGVGGRMDTLQCAIVLSKMTVFEQELKLRAKIAERYLSLLKTFDHVKPVTLAPNRDMVYAQFTLICDDREAVLEGLKAHNIPTAIHYPVPLHKQPVYAEFGAGESFPVSERLGKSVMSVPMSPYLTNDEMDLVLKGLSASARVPA